MSFPQLIFFFKLKYDKGVSQLYTRRRHTGHAQNPPAGSQSWPRGRLTSSLGRCLQQSPFSCSSQRTYYSVSSKWQCPPPFFKNGFPYSFFSGKKHYKVQMRYTLQVWSEGHADIFMMKADLFKSYHSCGFGSCGTRQYLLVLEIYKLLFFVKRKTGQYSVDSNWMQFQILASVFHVHHLILPEEPKISQLH